jgi:hypothetical protein
MLGAVVLRCGKLMDELARGYSTGLALSGTVMVCVRDILSVLPTLGADR